MRVVIAYPPDLHIPSMIFGALPLLSACLKERGHETELVDVNADAFDAMLHPQNLDRYFAIMDSAIEEFAAKPDRTPSEEAIYRRLLRYQVFPRELIREARACAEGMKDPDTFYDPERYIHMSRVVHTAHAWLSVGTPNLDPRNKNFIDQLYEYLEEERLDPYLENYQSGIFPRIREFGPQLVALSCPFSPQLATGMMFAKLLRRFAPETKVVMGGTGLSDHAKLMLGDPRFYDYVDFGIVGDGEESLPDLADAIESGEDEAFDRVPGLWRRSGADITEPSVQKSVNMDQNPVPDYTAVNFTLYMLPEKTAIYTTSRGCYYNKCTFCPESFRLSFRKRSPQKVFEDVRDMAERQGVRNIFFLDPLTPPITLQHVAKNIAKEHLDISWYAEVKFENIYTNRDYVKKLAEGGCRQLQFGFESGVQRVLDDMKKGNRLDQIEVMLDLLSEYGITVGVTWFIGFPTESEADARETWRFMRRRNDAIHLSFYTGTFGLGHDVPVFQHPERFGVDITFDDDGNLGYSRHDGADWDKKPLHEAFHARGDLPLSYTGAGLLYAIHHPERLLRIKGTTVVGPPSIDAPALAERFVRVGAENHQVRVGTDGLVFVASSGEIYEVDNFDYDLLRRIGRDGVQLSDVLDDSSAPTDITERVRRMVDRGMVESEDPLALVDVEVSHDTARI